MARILTELKLLDTRVGSIALSSAAIDDVTYMFNWLYSYLYSAWCLLAIVVSVARANHPLDALYTFLLLAAFVVVMLLVVRPLLNAFAKRSTSQVIGVHWVMVFLVSTFICAWYTDMIGILIPYNLTSSGVHAMFGAFILGIAVPRRNRFAASLIERIEDLVVIVFLPLYFTFSGLRTNIGSLGILSKLPFL